MHSEPVIVWDHMSNFSCPTRTSFSFISSLIFQTYFCFRWTAVTNNNCFLRPCSTNVRKLFNFPKREKKVNVHNNLMASMSQTLSSWILFRYLCSEITVLSNTLWFFLVWKRMNTSYFRHIAFFSGVKSFSNGFGYRKFLSSITYPCIYVETLVLAIQIRGQY